MFSQDQEKAAREARARYLQSLTVEESVAQYLAMMEEFGPLLEETEPIFRPQRMKYLAELQERIGRLNRGKTR